MIARVDRPGGLSRVRLLSPLRHRDFRLLWGGMCISLLGDGVFIGRNTILSCKNGDITIEDGANIGFNCEVFSASRVRIGAGTLLAAYCYLIGGDHDFSDPDVAVLDQQRVSAGIDVGTGAWLGAGAKILDGVTLGNGSVVGAGAVVRHAVPDGAIAVGIPARIVGQRQGAAHS